MLWTLCAKEDFAYFITHQQANSCKQTRLIWHHRLFKRYSGQNRELLESELYKEMAKWIPWCWLRYSIKKEYPLLGLVFCAPLLAIVNIVSQLACASNRFGISHANKDFQPNWLFSAITVYLCITSFRCRYKSSAFLLIRVSSLSGVTKFCFSTFSLSRSLRRVLEFVFISYYSSSLLLLLFGVSFLHYIGMTFILNFFFTQFFYISRLLLQMS